MYSTTLEAISVQFSFVMCFIKIELFIKNSSARSMVKLTNGMFYQIESYLPPFVLLKRPFFFSKSRGHACGRDWD